MITSTIWSRKIFPWRNWMKIGVHSFKGFNNYLYWHHHHDQSIWIQLATFCTREPLNRFFVSNLGRSELLQQNYLLFVHIFGSHCTFLFVLFNNYNYLKEKGEIIYEPDATVKVDEFGFFIFWKSDGRVSFLFSVIELY